MNNMKMLNGNSNKCLENAFFGYYHVRMLSPLANVSLTWAGVNVTDCNLLNKEYGNEKTVNA